MIITFADLIISDSQNPPLSTLCPSLDAFLGGGIPWGRLIQVSGTAGSGKSQFCMQLAASLKKHHPSKTALFLSGGKNNFLPDRYLQLCRKHGVAGGDDVLLGRVLVSKVKDFQGLMVALDNGAKKSVLDIGLICIESFGELIKDDPEQHFMHLDVLGKQLVEIAYEKKCIVICVNHATSRPTANGFQLVSALGAEWSLYSAFRLFFVSSTNPDHSKVGTLSLKKWPTATDDNWYYRLTASGFVSYISAA